MESERDSASDKDYDAGILEVEANRGRGKFKRGH